MVFSKFCSNQTCYSRQKLLHCKCLQGFMGFPCNILVNIIGKNNNLYRENLQLLCVKFINVIGEPQNLFRENLLTQQGNTIVGNFNNPCSFFPIKVIVVSLLHQILAQSEFTYCKIQLVRSLEKTLQYSLSANLFNQYNCYCIQQQMCDDFLETDVKLASLLI